MRHAERLDAIVYISLPDAFNRDLSGFKLRSDIMLPVESSGGEPEIDLKNLSWEMIISGMLKILAYDPHHNHAEYYRSFVMAVKPDILDEMTATAILKAQAKDWDIAEEVFLALIGLQPGNPRPILNLALMYDQRSEGYSTLGNDALAKEYEELAFSKYIQALSLKPELAEAHLYAGYFFLRQQSYPRARKEFTRYVEIGDDMDKIAEIRKILEQIEGSDNRDSLFTEAFDFIRMGKEREGLEKIDRFIKLQPAVWNGWFLKGWAHRRMGDYEDGYKAFSQARLRGGNTPDLLNEMAICAMESERLDESLSLLEEAVEQTPSDIKVLSNLGICCIKLKKFEEAQEYFLRVLDIDENDQIAIQYLGFIEEQI